jgi:hypothetical protein
MTVEGMHSDNYVVVVVEDVIVLCVTVVLVASDCYEAIANERVIVCA